MNGVANKNSMLDALGRIYKPLAENLATKEQLEQLDERLQMQVEGLPYTGFDYDFEEGELLLNYVEGTTIVEENFDFDEGDIIITPTT